jgi:hypothetical protein
MTAKSPPIPAIRHRAHRRSRTVGEGRVIDLTPQAAAETGSLRLARVDFAIVG